MAIEYKHTQPGYMTLGATGASFLFAAKHLAKGGPAALFLLPAAALMVGVGVVFSSQTNEIRDGKLRSYFGPGIPAKTVNIRDIESVAVVENPWWYGWGIRLTPQGTLYNVSGKQAVEVRLKNGRRFRLGTDEPEVLRRAILQSMQAESPGV